MVVRAIGRLDASWAEYFTEIMLGLIREGHHHLILDVKELSFLSSAGIRALLRINKELISVKGSFGMVNASSFVASTITMTGFGNWLAEDLPDEVKSLAGRQDVPDEMNDEIYILDPAAKLKLSVVADWVPWQGVDPGKVQRMYFPSSVFSLGIGDATYRMDEGHRFYGDFLAVGGHVLYQPPEPKARPDFLLAEKDYVPDLQVIQALKCEGRMSHLIRFSAGDQKPFREISLLAAQVLDTVKGKAAACVILAEADGLVGSRLTRSPGIDGAEGGIPFPEIREWISFTGERVFPGHLALIFGVIARNSRTPGFPLLKPMPSSPELFAHFHAAVFPYQSIQNGKINLMENVKKILNGPPPEALFHLVEDQRPAVGLGQSILRRGACWCSAVQNDEEERL